ncbi:hypothetical protein [Thalassolituus sp.]|uniref:hypothetical protein n=1 Tax=Thalassolituus sp. TaxID=2030822 RepID=UPI0026266FF1|nr:hypothetical protein [uncultured Thalassolituus sp.]TNC91574.1 MAG: hypothetical protein CSH36_08970 [Thalassolituus sp.]
MRRFSMALALSTLSLFALADAPKTTMDVIAAAQRDTTRPLIDYCALHQPELKDALEASFERYGAKVDEALAPLIEEVRKDTSAHRPEAELTALRSSLMAQAQQKINRLKVSDAGHYCRWMITQLDSVTVADFRKKMSDGYELFSKMAAAD